MRYSPYPDGSFCHLHKKTVAIASVLNEAMATVNTILNIYVIWLFSKLSY